MKIGSKLAIKKLKLAQPKNGNPFYSLTVMETVYNSKRPFKNKWETVYYTAYIFDTSLELEEAVFDLGVDENNKYSFKNISNPEKSIIRVFDFTFENHYSYKDNQIEKYEDGSIKFIPTFYLNDVRLGNVKWHSDTTLINKLEKRIKEQNATIKRQRLENIRTTKKYGTPRKDRSKITLLNEEIKKLKKTIADQQKTIDKIQIKADLQCKKAFEARDKARQLLKEGNLRKMVVNRALTLSKKQCEVAEKQTQKALAKLSEQKLAHKEELRAVRKMKKEAFIQKEKEEQEKSLKEESQKFSNDFFGEL